MRIDPNSFVPSGQVEAVTFGQLHHGTVLLDGQRVRAVLSEHYRGERRLIARDAGGRYVAVLVERASVPMPRRPDAVLTWANHRGGF